MVILIPKLKEKGKPSTHSTEKFKKSNSLFTAQTRYWGTSGIAWITKSRIPPIIIKVAKGITNKFESKK